MRNFATELEVAAMLARQKARVHGRSTWPVQTGRQGGIEVTAHRRPSGGFRMTEEPYKYRLTPRRFAT